MTALRGAEQSVGRPLTFDEILPLGRKLLEEYHIYAPIVRYPGDAEWMIVLGLLIGLPEFTRE